MPRYFFSLIDDRPVDDFGGQILADDETASRVAKRLASELRQVRPELAGKNYVVVASNNEAEEVCRAPLDRN